MRNLSLITVIALLLLGINVWAQSQEEVEPESKSAKIPPIGNITLMGSFSKVCGGNDVTGLYVSANYAPAQQLSENDYLIPLYSGLYKKQRQIVSEDEGGRTYTTIMNHNFSLMHKHLYSDRLTQRITGFATLTYNKETADESFGDGLYDYRDYGLLCDYQYQLVKTDSATGTYLIGGKYYFREYPNFSTLISLAAQTAPEEDEKDQQFFGLTNRYTHHFSDQGMLAVSYDYLFKDYTDKKTIDSDGILTDEERQDQVHLFRLNTNYRMGTNFILGLDAEVELNNSDQNYYDTLETPAALADDIFVPHYFDYNSFEIRPCLTYLRPLGEKKTLICKLSYGYTNRDYTNRNVKDAQGNYKDELQEDMVHALYLNVSYPLSEKFSLLFSADYAHNISNMEYERYYRYDYDLYHILSGFSYKF